VGGSNERKAGDRARRAKRKREQEGMSQQDELSSKNECSIAFSNESQFLILNEASLRDLQSKLPVESEVTSLTFRPNFVLKGDLEPFEEDTWTQFSIGNHLFKVTFLF